MKFECPSCGKKYSLPDEKVPAGKDFKVKCKKCSEIIVLRGPGGEAVAAPAEPAAVQQPAPEPEQGAPFEQAPPADDMGPDEQPTRVFDYSRMSNEGELPPEDQGPADFVSAQAGAFQAAAAEQEQEEAPAPAAAAAAAAAAAPAMDDYEWHIAVDGDQMGPYETTQIGEMLAAGQITDETFAWRDGFGDWLPIRDIAELTGGGEAVVPAASPFAAAEPGPASDSPFAIGSGGGKSHDLFASPGSDGTTESPFGGDGGGDGGDAAVSTSLDAEPQSPRVDAGGLKGARHENSVLFSLSSLQALASSSKDPAPGGGGGEIDLGSPGGLGSATTEGGSGLIDIRAMTAGVPSTATNAPPSDDILSIGGQGIGSPMGVPSLLQPVKKEPSKLPYILGGVGGLVAIGILVVVLVVVLKGKDSSEGAIDEEAMRAQILKELMESGMGKAEAEKLATEQAAEKAAETEDEGATTEDEGEGEEEASTSSSKKSGSKKKKKGSSSSTSESSTSSTTPSTTKTPPPSTAPSKGSIEDDLLSALKGGGGKKKTTSTKTPTKTTPTPTPAASTLPEKPTKAQVMAALKGVTPKVKSCGKGWHGVAKTSINVGGATGKVMSATVVSGPTDASVKSCVVKAVKSAKFPKFQQKKFTVAYPFVI